MADSLKQKTISGVSWNFINQVLSRGLSFVIGIILARLLTPADYGLIGMLGIFLALSQVFIDGGFASALIQCQNRTEKDLATVYIINIGMSIFLYLVLFATAPLIARFYDQPILTSLTRVFTLSLVISALSSVHGTLLTIRVDFKTKTFISLIKAILTGAIAITCAYKGMGVWTLVVQGLSSAFFTVILSWIFVRWYPKTGFSKESFHKLFSYGSKLLAASLISEIYNNIYPLVIGKTAGATDAGLYSKAGHFPQLGSGVITGMINRVAFPIFSQIQDDNPRLLRAYDKYIQFSCFIIFPILMGICGCAKPLVILLLTEKWEACIPLMQILCFASLFTGVTTINLNLLYVKGRSDLVLKLEIIKKSIAFAILFATAFFGVTVMCYGQIVYSFIALFLNTIYTKKILNYGLWDQIKVMLPYLGISLVILAEGFGLCHFIQNNWIALGASVALCSITYIALHALFHTFAFAEALSWLKTKKTKQ